MPNDPAAEHRPPHMTPDEFRALGHRVVDRVADYMARVGELDVKPRATPGDVLAALPDAAPETPQPWDDILADLDSIIIPNLTHWQHPGFFAYFPCNASGPGILGELLSAGLNVNGMLWSTSPAATELETRVLDWCRRLFGLPEAFTGNGVIQGTASESTLIALLAAKHRAGVATPALITSDQAHSSVIKAAMIAGLADGPEDHRRVRKVRTTPDGAMDLDHLREILTGLTAEPEGPEPVMVSATVGTTGTGAVDDIAGIRRILDDTGRPVPGGSGPASPCWLHIDAAWAGAAAVCPEHRHLLAGAEHADSVCLNPHKWLLTNFDCDLFWVRDRGALLGALSITPEYLRNEQSDARSVIDYRDWQIPLGRRFRALKLWFVLRHYGVEGLRAHIRRHVAWAAWFESQVAADDRFELVAPNRLALVCFALKAGDAPTRALLERVNGTGEVFLSHTTSPGSGPNSGPGGGRYTIRFTPGATLTRFEHVARAWAIIAEAADDILR